MKVQVRSIRLTSRKEAPHFAIHTEQLSFPQDSVIVKVLAFSLDPVMRVWLSGAKTNFRVVKEGDVFNCFGVGQVVQSNHQSYPVNTYIFGNTGTVNYLCLTQEKMLQCFPVDQDLITQYGPDKFLYLINNGLAAFQGYQILEVCQKDKVVVSTAAGATGLLLCHLLKKKNVQIIAICSSHKQKYIQAYTDNIIDYKDRAKLKTHLKKSKFNKYFDNVGESQLDIVLQTIKDFGILALCGAIEGYLQPKEGGVSGFPNIISKRLKLQGINFSSLVLRASEIFQEYKDANLLIHTHPLQKFIPLFSEIYKSGGSIVGKVIIDPHK